MRARQQLTRHEKTLTDDLKIFGFLQQQLEIAEILRNQQLRVAHEVEDVPEHVAIAVDEVVLLVTGKLRFYCI